MGEQRTRRLWLDPHSRTLRACPASAQEVGRRTWPRLRTESMRGVPRCPPHRTRLPESTGVATFKAIANTPGMTPTALAVWFQTSHPTMPNFILAPEDRDDVIAYIVSLRDGQNKPPVRPIRKACPRRPPPRPSERMPPGRRVARSCTRVVTPRLAVDPTAGAGPARERSAGVPSPGPPAQACTCPACRQGRPNYIDRKLLPRVPSRVRAQAAVARLRRSRLSRRPRALQPRRSAAYAVASFHAELSRRLRSRWYRRPLYRGRAGGTRRGETGGSIC